ncbi:MAG: phosphodiester glycosidase family protein [Clostridiaceae bacterium]|nr:phosphodiester glycosidase family protein [Clostridiaceae bacterium]
MKKPFRRAASAALALSLAMTGLVGAAKASGGEYSYKRTDEISDGLNFSSEYLKSSSGAGNRTYIFDYSPGSDTLPIIAYGDGLYGKSNVNDVVSYCQSKGYTVMAAINADFFNMTTGIPTGIVIKEGRLCSSDGSWNAVGFKKDGSALCGAPKLDMTFSVNGGQRFPIAAFNKVRDSSGAFLYSADYGSSTRLTAEGAVVIMKKVSSKDYMTVGGSISLKVVEAGMSQGASVLDDDTFVLTYQKAVSLGIDITALKSGDIVTVYTSTRSSGWDEVYYACGAGDVLIENSALSSIASVSTTKSPRTVLGIRNDGSIVMMVTDGRVSGIADGMTLKEAALKLYEMGCKNVVNLDGGGSSIASMRYPGFKSSAVVSDPSDGSPRKCATYIVFVNNGDKDDDESTVCVYPKDTLVLAGGRVDFSAYSYNDSYYPAGQYSDCFYVSKGDGTVVGNTLTVPNYAGTTTVSASVGKLKSNDAVVTSIIKPETMDVVKKGSDSSISSLSLEPSETVDLDVIVTDGLRKIVSTDEQFTFAVTGGIGQINESGLFTASDVQGTSGSITVSFGEVSRTITVSVGTAPKVICDFEGDISFSVSALETTKAAAKVYHTPDNARYGMGSLGMGFTAATEDTPVFVASNSFNIAAGMKQITLMAKGEGSWYVDFQTSSGTVSKEIVSKADQWTFNIIDIPTGTTAITGFRAKASVGESTAIYIDQIIGHYGAAQSDYTPPQITLVAFEYDLELTITDDGKYPLEKSNITVKVDGNSYTDFTFDEISGQFNVNLPQDGVIHKVTVEARDYFGNLSRFIGESQGTVTGPFGDLSGHWGETYINYLYTKGIFTADEAFRPQANATNEMVATIISRYMGIDVSKYSDVQLPYADLDKIHDWALPHVKALYSLGIMQGGSDNSGKIWFYPIDAASRARVMTVLGRTISRGYNYPTASFSDFDSVPYWAKDHISLLSYLGIVKGYGGTNEVMATAGITRSEIAAMLYRLY